jgi:hypothetical protein
MDHPMAQELNLAEEDGEVIVERQFALVSLFERCSCLRVDLMMLCF